MPPSNTKNVLKVDSVDKISEFEDLLNKGSITFVLIYADWCGACTRFKKNIWNPMCKKSAVHSRVAVRDDMIKKTSLASANFDYLPSLIVIDENRNLQSFKTPEGEDTHAMPTPQSLKEMNRIVNVPVEQNAIQQNKQNKQNAITQNAIEQNKQNAIEESPEIPLSNATPLTLVKNSGLTLRANEPLSLNVGKASNLSKPSSLGKRYIPTPMVAPRMKGGRRATLKIPKKVLKGLASLFKRSRKVKN